MNENLRPLPAFQQSAVIIRTLSDQLLRLEASSHLLQVAPLAGREWYDVLRQKLLPQLGSDAWLVAAVVGGTNIGKSVVFNHLAGCRASASSPLASGTRHPVCLVPAGFSDSHPLQSVFPDFELHEWGASAEPLGESDRHQLFWRTAPELPPTLLILDTPDIDSDARVNWVRADAVRRCADVLIAVLTQQKYNDAAVKEFFRKAAAEDKSIVVIFNQCLLPDDEQYWPVWLETFSHETGIQPDAVYVAPTDRRAAENLRLPFFPRPWPVPANWNPAAADDGQPPAHWNTPGNLTADLSRLRFHDIRMRTLAGSLQELVHPDRGVPSYLAEVALASEELASTAERLSSETVLRIRNWPTPANAVLVRLIRTWWQARQEGWVRRVNSFYNVVGTGILWPLRAARVALQGEPVDPMEEYRQREWSSVLTVIDELFEKLQWMADSGNRLIRPRIAAVLEGSSRHALIAEIKARHDAIDFEEELTGAVDHEMLHFQQNSPDLFRFYRQLHNASAAVRPMTSVVLFSLGFGPAGEVVAPFVAGAAAQTVVHVVAEVTGGTAAALAGDVAVSGAAATGSGLLQAWFHRLHSSFTARRAEWLTRLIHSELLGTLPEELRRAAEVSRSEFFLGAGRSVDQLKQLLESGRED